MKNESLRRLNLIKGIIDTLESAKKDIIKKDNPLTYLEYDLKLAGLSLIRSHCEYTGENLENVIEQLRD